MMGYGDVQPDAFIIFDDVLVDHVTAGLIDAGVRIGEDVDVVAHCNYPLIKPDQWPIQRLGYDTAAIFAQALDLLRRNSGRNAGAPTRDRTAFPGRVGAIQAT